MTTTGSKDGLTWEEQIRKNKNIAHNRFSEEQMIKNLTLLRDWCDKKIQELKRKIENE